MPLTPNLSLVVVGGQFVDVAGVAIAGQVKFTPRTIIVDSSYNQIIIPRTVTVDLDATGSFTVTLPATDDADLSPLAFTYRVEEAFTGGRTYDISLPAAVTPQNLADVSPAVAASGTEATTYVLLSVYTALEARVTTVEGVTTAVATDAAAAAVSAGLLASATDAAKATRDAAVLQQTAATSAAATLAASQAAVIHPFIFVGM